MALVALLLYLLGATLFNVGGTVPGSGLAPAVQTSRAELEILHPEPLTVVGRTFKQREQVRVSVDGKLKSVVAGPGGGFKISFPEANACNGVIVVAHGSKGSRASLAFNQLSNFYCLGPGGSSGTPSAARPAARATLKIVGFDPVSVAGRAFKAGERVRLSAGGRRQSVTADHSGGFKVFFPGAAVCGGNLVVARGSEGSHASVSFANLSNVHCLAPGTKG
jgi:hypothetical protein